MLDARVYQTVLGWFSGQLSFAQDGTFSIWCRQEPQAACRPTSRTIGSNHIMSISHFLHDSGQTFLLTLALSHNAQAFGVRAPSLSHT